MTGAEAILAVFGFALLLSQVPVYRRNRNASAELAKHEPLGHMRIGVALVPREEERKP